MVGTQASGTFTESTICPLRVDGKLCNQQADGTYLEGPEVELVLELLSKKYNLPSSPERVASGYVWLFQLAPRKNA
jgi:hypothetical protein